MASKLKTASVIAIALSTLTFGLTGAQSADPIPAFDEATATGLALDSMPRSKVSGESIYFVMPDRYANGRTSNDQGAGDFYGGFNAADFGYFHGGDLVGLTQNIDRIKDMGFTAIWITPVNVQQAVQGSSAAYHGYWGLDFTTIDPHFGDEEQFQDFVDAAKQRDMKVYLDIVVNHTADVIAFPEGYSYTSLSSKPFKDANGNVVNLANLGGLDLCTLQVTFNCFPSFNNASFPKTIVLGNNNQFKNPAFLRNPHNYHNRGSISDWNSWEQSTYGDFVGLDDLMTDNPVVIEGWAEVWADWITKYGIDGFRIDTARHVGETFFNEWTPLIYEKVAAEGMEIPDLFGEFAISDPSELSEYVREYGLPSALDFYSSFALVNFAQGGTAQDFNRIFEFDDLYNIGNSPRGDIGNAYGLVTFIGNHDKGRAASLIGAGMWGASSDRIASRTALAYSTLLLMRGAPTVYYGDEVGMMGDGGDKAARQDMFPTQVPFWKTEERAGMAPIGNRSSLTITSHPIMNRIKAVNELRENHPALTNGTLQSRKTSVKPSRLVNKKCRKEAKSVITSDKWLLTCINFSKKRQVWRADFPNQVPGWSRFDSETNTEYVVLANTSDGARTVTISTSTPSTVFNGILGTSQNPTSLANGNVTLKVAARSVAVLRAAAPVPAVTAELSASISYDRYGNSSHPEIKTTLVGSSSPAVATFVYRTSSSDPWTLMGSDDNRNYMMVVPDWVWGEDDEIEIAAIIRTPNGRMAVSPIVTAQKP
jgi:glycosidase